MPTFLTKKNQSSYDEVQSLLSRTRSVDGCLVWTGAVNTDGYPRASRRDSHGIMCANVKLHRHIVEHTLGITLTPEQIICHSCDNPLCINPTHLSVGSPSSNMQDRRDRGRTAYHVSEKEIELIQSLSQTGMKGTKIAHLLNANVKRIYYVLKKY